MAFQNGNSVLQFLSVVLQNGNSVLESLIVGLDCMVFENQAEISLSRELALFTNEPQTPKWRANPAPFYQYCPVLVYFHP